MWRIVVDRKSNASRAPTSIVYFLLVLDPSTGTPGLLFWCVSDINYHHFKIIKNFREFQFWRSEKNIIKKKFGIFNVRDQKKKNIILKNYKNFSGFSRLEFRGKKNINLKL